MQRLTNKCSIVKGIALNSISFYDENKKAAFEIEKMTAAKPDQHFCVCDCCCPIAIVIAIFSVAVAMASTQHSTAQH